MTSRDFAHWLQGFFELTESPTSHGLNGTQRALIEKHLALVFIHEIDPSAGKPAHQATLNAVHAGEPWRPGDSGVPSDPNAPKPRC